MDNATVLVTTKLQDIFLPLDFYLFYKMYLFLNQINASYICGLCVREKVKMEAGCFCRLCECRGLSFCKVKDM